MSVQSPQLSASMTARRRTLLLGALALGSSQLVSAAPTRPAVQVWKDPNCGCCKDWIAHLEQNGFTATQHDQGNNAARSRLGMPKKYASCHTALVQGYVLEGHVPAAEVHRLLKEKPAALGLAVPGMPVGSPGMDGPEYGGRRDRYDVLLIQKDASSSVYKTYS